MSDPINLLRKSQRVPVGTKRRAMPFRHPGSGSGSELSNGRKGQSKNKEAAPSDMDLMSSMMNRLHKVEGLLRTAQTEIEAKDVTIRKLRERLDMFETMHAAEKNESQAITELTRKCTRLQKQIHGMENFLLDYGMVWVGEDDEEDDIPVSNTVPEKIETKQQPTGKMWSHNAGNDRFIVDYDKIISNIQELNALAGEGVGVVSKDKHGAQRIKMKEPVPLRLFKDGIYMFNGPFRPLADVETQVCLQDLMDGFFPSELQSRYPDGVPFKVYDLRTDNYEAAKSKDFPGAGLPLGGDAKPSRLILHNENASEKPIPVESFLNQLPRSIIKGGRVIDIRNGVADALTSSPTNSKVTVVNTDVMSQIKEHTLEADAQQEKGLERPMTPRDIATIQVKSMKGRERLILKLRFTDTIAMLRKSIDKHSGASSNRGYKLLTSFPRKVCRFRTFKTIVHMGALGRSLWMRVSH
eukprot:m.102863 g.102863  ORF g.102863 m.102863 type:complete len:467 (+) comp13788_c0_seq3:107-1507(+)